MDSRKPYVKGTQANTHLDPWSLLTQASENLQRTSDTSALPTMSHSHSLTQQKKPKRKASTKPKTTPGWLKTTECRKTELLEARRQAEIDKKFQEECTFRPTINQPTVVRTEPIEDRLLAIGTQQRLKTQLLAEAMEKLEFYSFQPSVSEHSSPSRGPVHLRVSKDQVARETELNELRKSMDSELTFRPQLGKVTRQLAKDRKSLLPTAADSQELPPNPQPKRVFDLAGFLDRETQFCKEKAFRLQRKSAESLPAHSFQPSLNVKSRVLAGEREVPSKLVTRLSLQDPVRRKEARIQLQDDFFKQFPHSPVLNPVSQAIGKASSMPELVSNMRMPRFVTSEECQLREHCSFQPQINPSKLRSVYANPAEVLANIQQAQERRDLATAELTKELFVEQQKGCTFKPERCKYRPAKDVAAPVRGFEQFLALRKQAKAKLEAHEAREAEVFGLKNPGIWMHCFTTPTPFNLSSSAKKVTTSE